MIINSPQNKISKAKDIAGIMKEILEKRPDEEQHKEYFYSLGLNSRNILQYIDLSSIGSISSCVPYTREILRTAIIKNAACIILCHNHPSGTIKPSIEDRRFTQEIGRACEIMGIKLLDHIIIGETFYSFADEGDLNHINAI